MSLTELTIAKLKVGVHMDQRTPDFGIRVGKRRRSWIIVRGAGRVKETFGHYPALSLSEARTEAKRLLAGPPEPKVVSKAWEDARDAFLAENYTAGSTTHYQVKRSLERHFKSLRGRLIDELTDGQIKACLDAITAPSEKLHAFRYARAMLNWCARPPRKWLKISPMHGYEPPGKDRKGTRTLTDDELMRIWRACEDPRFAFFRILILWGTRNTETCVLEREWVVDGVLTIPGEHTKNGRDHAIPVLSLAETVLDAAIGSHQHYFAGRKTHLTPGAIGKLKREVMKLSKTKGWQVRDIRRTFRTNMRRLGVGVDVCEALINHAPAALLEIYDRYHLLPEKRAALEKWEEFLQALLARDATRAVATAPSMESCNEAALQAASA